MTIPERRERLDRIRRDERVRRRRRLLSVITVIGMLTAMNTVALLVVVVSFDNRVISSTFTSEQICSRTHQGAPCRALFDRLWTSLTDQQRFRIACESLVVLENPATTRIHRQAGCP